MRAELAAPLRPEDPDEVCWVLDPQIHRCIHKCMRTNIVLNDDLLREAQRYSSANSKSALVEEALRTLVEVRSRERAAETYASRLRKIQQKLQDKTFRETSAEILRGDRKRP